MAAELLPLGTSCGAQRPLSATRCSPPEGAGVPSVALRHGTSIQLRSPPHFCLRASLAIFFTRGIGGIGSRLRDLLPPTGRVNGVGVRALSMEERRHARTEVLDPLPHPLRRRLPLSPAEGHAAGVDRVAAKVAPAVVETGGWPSGWWAGDGRVVRGRVGRGGRAWRWTRAVARAAGKTARWSRRPPRSPPPRNARCCTPRSPGWRRR